ncbi:MAG: DUF4231 domain-containing protein [bacterium]
MNSGKFQEYLKERYENQIAWYDQKAIWNQKRYKIFQWSVIVLSAITPILVVIAVGGEWQRWTAVVVSALVAIGTTALKTFKYQENWINYRTTCETLRKEIYYYQAGIQGYEDSEDREALFIERVESLISRENTLWIISQKQEEKKAMHT